MEHKTQALLRHPPPTLGKVLWFFYLFIFLGRVVFTLREGGAVRHSALCPVYYYSPLGPHSLCVFKSFNSTHSQLVPTCSFLLIHVSWCPVLLSLFQPSPSPINSFVSYLHLECGSIQQHGDLTCLCSS